MWWPSSLQQLLKANILRGSIERGVSVHDLVRDCMVRRTASSSVPLPEMQRQAVPLLLAAFDAGEMLASKYVTTNLRWHIRQAQSPDVAIEADPLMMGVLTHQSADIRRQGALGIGIGQLCAAADSCDASGEHMRAAELMHAACAL